jgi:hypothetical protein
MKELEEDKATDKKGEEEEDKETDMVSGVTTTTSAVSLQDYFKLKMGTAQPYDHRSFVVRVQGD